ncbi:MAG: hypothetical protein J6Y24_11085 [Bacteroidales bacterium]|nr:hypothetical protein [Bacteroidales bacterium]
MAQDIQKKEDKQNTEELFKLLLKKSGLSYTDFLFLVKHNYIASNLDMLSAEEKLKYKVKVA